MCVKRNAHQRKVTNNQQGRSPWMGLPAAAPTAPPQFPKGPCVVVYGQLHGNPTIGQTPPNGQREKQTTKRPRCRNNYVQALRAGCLHVAVNSEMGGDLHTHTLNHARHKRTQDNTPNTYAHRRGHTHTHTHTHTHWVANANTRIATPTERQRATCGQWPQAPCQM